MSIDNTFSFTNILCLRENNCEQKLNSHQRLSLEGRTGRTA